MHAHRPLVLVLLLAGLGSLAAAARADAPRRISVSAKDLPMPQLLLGICKSAHLNVYLGPETQGKKATVELQDVDVIQALRLICKLHGLGLGVTPDEHTVLIGSQAVLDSMDLGAARVVTLSHQDPEKLAATLNKVYQGRIQAIPDAQTNSVVLVPLKNN